MLVIFVVIVIAAGYVHSSDDYLVVETLQGPVLGYKSLEGEFYGFYGIPYATEPKGADKFKAPFPAPVWNVTLKAVNRNVYCAQTLDTYSSIAENCLVVNLYVPKNNEKNMSVLIQIHGGRFIQGHGISDEPQRLAVEGNIITVTFNYRLGANGFLCLGTNDAPGNAGIKDQIAMLVWVKNNIAYFGGNPNDVTISGKSAGSVSVDILLLSELSNGLFHKAIHESGNAMSWSVQTDPVANALETAASFNYYPNDIYELELFYKTLPLKDLIESGNRDFPDGSYKFEPCIEKDNGDNTAVLTKSPFDIIKNQTHNRVPILTGVCNQEGSARYDAFKPFKNLFQNNITAFLPQDIKIADANEIKEVKKMLKDIYFVNDSATILSFISIEGDKLFVYPATKITKARAAAGFNVYLYLYTFYDNLTQTPLEGITGATHTSQTRALNEYPSQNITFDESHLSDDYKKVRKEMRNLWISFVKNGKPVIEPTMTYPLGWPPATAKGYPYMTLGLQSELSYNKYLLNTTHIWETIYDKYYVKPIPPRDNIKP